MGDEKLRHLIVLGEEPDFVLGSAHVSPSRRTVKARDRDYQLEPRVMQVLVALAQAAGNVVTRDMLSERCWGGQVVADDSLNRAISKLRRIADESGSFKLETVRGVGYRITPGRSGASGRSRRRLLAAALLLAVVLGALLAGRSWLRAPDSSSPRIVAVLPFEDLSAALGAGASAAISEEIITRLAEEPSLRVIGRTSAAILGSKATAADARRRLAASHVVEGSYQRRGPMARISVRLVETATGMVLWSQAFDRSAGELPLLQDEIASEVAERLRLTAAGEVGRTLPRRTSAQVYDLYLQAVALERQQTAPAVRRAIALLQRAIGLDPEFAPAFARLATNMRWLNGSMPSGSQRAESLRYARRALSLAPQSGYAYAAMASVLETEQDWAEAIPYLQRAIALDPSNFPAWQMLGHIQHYHQCRPVEAAAAYRRALVIEPLMARPYDQMILLLAEMGRFDEAEAIVRRFERAAGDPAQVSRLKGVIRQYKGDLSRSVALFREADRLDPAGSDSTLVQLLRPLGLTGQALSTRSVRQTPGLGPMLRGDGRPMAELSIGLGDEIWKLRWRHLASATSALLREGRSESLIRSFDRNYRTVDSFNAELGCREAAAFLPHLVLALRLEGRTADSARLLAHARNRYDEARRAGYTGAVWEAVNARLLVLEGRRPESVRAFRSAVDSGWLDQFWPYVSADDPVFDLIAADPAFRRALAQQRREQRRERTELERSRPQPRT